MAALWAALVPGAARTAALRAELERAQAALRTEAEGRRLAEARLKDLQEQLQQQTAQPAREPQPVDPQAQKLEAVGRLAGGIAHDFNNLLSVVLGRAELLLRQSKEAAVAAHAAYIRDAAQRGARLTSQLLAFARRQVLQPRPLDLAEMVRRTQGLLQPLLGEAVDLRLELDEGLPAVMADAGQLEQVLLNLVLNARDALPPQGGMIKVRARAERPDDCVAGPPDGPGSGACAVLEVEDNGHGIAPEHEALIFEPFFTTKGAGKGSGLGLAMVQGAVRQSGGQVKVLGRPGDGAVFRVCLPLAQGAAPAPTSAASMPAAPGHAATVLLAEDDEDLRRLLQVALDEGGYKVLSGQDLRSALAAARAHSAPIDLLLTDLVMPDGSGVDLAATLLKERPGLKVVLMTGYTEAKLPEPGQMVYRFLQKPFSPVDLLTLLRQVLDA